MTLLSGLWVPATSTFPLQRTRGLALLALRPLSVTFGASTPTTSTARSQP